MNSKKSGGGKATSSEEGISSISLDPSLTSEGIGGLDEVRPPVLQAVAATGQELDKEEPSQSYRLNSTQKPGQDVWDPDNRAYHTIASRG
jgi:hypothetical protein